MADRDYVEIRPARIDDLAAIFHLGERVFTAQRFTNLYRTWDEYEVTWLFNSDPELILVAEADDQVVGFAMGTTIEKSRTAWNYGHLLWLGVAPGYARMGIGSMLFDRFRAVVEELGVRIMLVDTQADNEPAIAFFRRKGFGNPTDHVYLTLNLEKYD
ncbi:MAG: N-acetyltransferase [Verrucomicrobiota bacterium]|jgi:ribosomal protein S18 acetylase RimI-like enzyme|nr:N-acetyltransferase [Verrucomicrobiota bacterium]MDD8046784.1 N-acetyltransferase [Verrucomicrobiota bacterium]MDD8051193.1 N-acetyltransferase [Verrucomicrobiota bacterium]MDI9384420.1 N-acetyltransferase [Verrucomicrobiota bacterium]HCF96004.1 GNAT family N-acetyltransferase [Verrucomicrobiota bacterium]